MKFENTEVFNFEGALRGMRNPKNSWDKSDSKYCLPNDCAICPRYNKEPHLVNGCELYSTCAADDVSWIPYQIGENDMKLAKMLASAGPEHGKYLRMIFVSVDITAPMFWDAELDTYKIGTVRDSCSFMHKGVSKPFEISDFDTCGGDTEAVWDVVIKNLNELRDKYLVTKDEKYFQMIRAILPAGYNYRFTWTANYAVLRTIYFQRRNHRLPHWHDFCDWIKSLPYSELITCEKEN